MKIITIEYTKKSNQGTGNKHSNYHLYFAHAFNATDKEKLRNKVIQSNATIIKHFGKFVIFT